MKKIALFALTAAMAFPVFASQEKPAAKEQPKMAEACKNGCKMPDDKCSKECMKSCADHAAKMKAKEHKAESK